MANLILLNIKHVHGTKSGMALCHDYDRSLIIIYLAFCLAEELLKIQVFWFIRACRLANSFRRSEGFYCCCFQDQAVQNPSIFNKTVTGKPKLTTNSFFLWKPFLAFSLSSREDGLLSLHVWLWTRKEWTIKGYCVDGFVIPEVFA